MYLCKFNMYVYIYNGPSCLSAQWLCSNSCTWVHDVRNHVPKCMIYHKAVAVITRSAHCLYNYIYITPVLLLCYLSICCCGI